MDYFPFILTVLSELAGQDDTCDSSSVGECMDEEQMTAEMLEKRERRRKKIISELFETEKTYLHHLSVAHKAGLKFFKKFYKFTCTYHPNIKKRK